MLNIFNYFIEKKNDIPQINNKLEHINIDILNNNIISSKNDNLKLKFYFDDNFITVLYDSLDKNYFIILKITDNVIKIKFKLHIYTFCNIEKIILKNNIVYNIISSSVFNNIRGEFYFMSIGDVIDELRNINEKLYYLLQKNI